MSSKDVLSEGEIDALMDSVSSGDVPLETSSGKASYQPFDFTTREQALVAKMPGLQTLLKNQATLLGESISQQFKSKIVVEPEDINVLKLEEALVAIPESSALNLIKVNPLIGTTLVVIEGQLLSGLVNQFFGGKHIASTEKTVTTKPRRAFSPSENRINELVVQKFINALEQSWKEKLLIKPELIKNTQTDTGAQIGSDYEQILQFGFQLRGRDWNSLIHWIVPYTMLEPIKAKLEGNSTKPAIKSSSSWESEIRQVLLSVDVEMSASFSAKKVSLADVLALKVGSIVPLTMPTQAMVKVEGQWFGLGEHGEKNKKKSIKITERL